MMKKLLLLISVFAALSLSSVIASRPAEKDMHARHTCMVCWGKACPKGTRSGVCNCTVYYRCPNDQCSLTVCDGCYYKYILPNLNKGCPVCKGHKQFKQVH